MTCNGKRDATGNRHALFEKAIDNLFLIDRIKKIE